MTREPSTQDLSLSREQQEQIRIFWDVYDAHYDEVRAQLQGVLHDHPTIGPIMAAIPQAEQEHRDAMGRDLIRRAVLEGDWEPYRDHLHALGGDFAAAGVPFASWSEIVTAFRPLVRPHLLAAYGDDRTRLLDALEGMGRFIDRAVATVGEAYLQSRETTIARQAEALRELSTPVLQVREGLLIMPIVGAVDSERARQITEQLLYAIRDRRAHVVVIDITGVPNFDSSVANHLVQTVEAARLMGASAVLTGISAEAAQTLATLGVELRNISTVGDLQGGIDEADRLLGYRVITVDSEDV